MDKHGTIIDIKDATRVCLENAPIRTGSGLVYALPHSCRDRHLRGWEAPLYFAAHPIGQIAGNYPRVCSFLLIRERGGI